MHLNGKVVTATAAALAIAGTILGGSIALVNWLDRVQAPDLALSQSFPTNYDVRHMPLGAVAFGGQSRCSLFRTSSGNWGVDGTIHTIGRNPQDILAANILDDHYEVIDGQAECGL